MATFLNVEDFDLILSERDSMRRVGLACRLYADFEAGALDAGEMRASLSVFRTLARDNDIEARARFARFVANSPALPRDIVARLAADVRAVAAPVIGSSPVLVDDMLVDLSASPDAWRQIAVARRASVSRSVAAALIEVACAEACRVLIANPGATLPATAFDRLGERFPDHHLLRDAMLDRPGAPAALIEKHLTAVADRLSRFVTEAGWLDGRTARLSTGSAVDQALIFYASGCAPEVLRELVARWAGEGRISAVFLLRAAICGSDGVFEHAVAALARLPVERIRTLMRDRGGYGFRSLCARMGLGGEMEGDLARIRAARLDVVGRNPMAPSAESARRIVALLFDPRFVPQTPISPMAATVARDVGRSLAVGVQPSAGGGMKSAA